MTTAWKRGDMYMPEIGEIDNNCLERGDMYMPEIGEIDDNCLEKGRYIVYARDRRDR